MKYSFKVVGLTLVAIINLGSAANAQQGGEINPEKRALIRELFLATKADKLAESFIDVTMAQVERDLPRLLSETLEPSEPASDREQVGRAMADTSARILARFRRVLPQRINFAEEMEQIFYPIYDRFFTEDELKDLVVFYKSRTGQKSIDVMPRLMQDAVTRSSQALAPKVTQVMNEVLAEEKNRHKPARASSK